MNKAPTTDQIRDRIDSGQTGEKIGFPDPAAAPLGTDDEAAGKTATTKERQVAAHQQPRRREGPPADGRLVYFVAIAAVAVVAIAIVLLAG